MSEKDPIKEYEDLVRFIAAALLDTEEFEVTSSTRDSQLLIKLAAPEGVRGRVIGKGGRIARSIRTLLEAAAIDSDLSPSLDIVD